MRNPIILGLVFLLFISCKDKPIAKDGIIKNKRENDRCTNLNEIGVRYLNLFLYSGGEDSISLIEAEKNLRLAVKCDENFLIARNNLLSVYNLMGDYPKALKMVKEQAKLDPENVQWVAQKALLYKEIGYLDSAKAQYIKGNEAYRNLMIKFPDSLDIILESMVLNAYFNEPVDYLERLESLKGEYPEESDKIDHYYNLIVDIPHNRSK